MSVDHDWSVRLFSSFVDMLMMTPTHIHTSVLLVYVFVRPSVSCRSVTHEPKNLILVRVE